METQKTALEKRLKDLWKNKVVRYVRFYFAMITIEKIFKASTEFCCLLFYCKKEVTLCRDQKQYIALNVVGKLLHGMGGQQSIYR